MAQRFELSKKFLQNELINQAIDKMKSDFSNSIYTDITSREVLEDILLDEYSPYVLKQIKAYIEISKPDYDVHKEISIQDIYNMANKIGLSKFVDISYRVFHKIITREYNSTVRFSKRTALLVWAFLIVRIDYQSIPQLIEQQRRNVAERTLQRYSTR